MLRDRRYGLPGKLAELFQEWALGLLLGHLWLNPCVFLVSFNYNSFLGRKWLVSFLRPVLVLQFFPFPLFPSPSLFSFLPCPQLLWYSFCYYDHIRSFDRSIRFVPRQAEKKTEKKDSEEELVPDTTSNRSSQDSEKKQGAKGLASAQVHGT